MSITAAVSMVETFLNALSQRLVILPEYRHAESIVEDFLKRRRPLELKLRDLPAALFGQRFDSTSDEMARFDRVRCLRNELMHFSSKPAVLEIAGQGILMTDTTVYDQLSIDDGVEAANAAYALIKYVLRLVHSTDQETEIEMHYWTGTRAAPQ